MLQYDAIFISTFINHLYVDKLIDSIISHNKRIKLYLLFINQTDISLNINKSPSKFIHVEEIFSKRVSLSAARNIGIKYVLENTINAQYVLFPDDDSTFDDVFFNCLSSIVKDGRKNYLIDVYVENTNELYIKNNLPDGKLVINNKPQVAMSVNMLINMQTFKAVGFFDEKMGVGAEYGAGEDTDYFIRCVAFSGAFIYTKMIWNYHPDFEDKHNTFSFKQLLKKYRNYGRGVIYMNMKHHFYFSAFKLCISALGGSVLALINLDFRLSLARLYAFFVRSFTFVMLIIRIYK
jgi:hypothetical protein